MRLIDADILRRKLLEKQVTTYYDNMEKREVIGETVALIDDMPTAYDVEAVCKKMFFDASDVLGYDMIELEVAKEIVRSGGI